MPISALHISTILIIGFSVFSAGILLIAYLFFLNNMEKSAASRVAFTVLIASLTGLQLYHLDFLLFDAVNLFDYRLYVVLLLTTPPAFYFFSRELLLPDSKWSAWQVVHVVPVALAFFLPVNIVAPVALAIGAGYSIWLVRIVYGMRRHVGRFRFEMFFFGFFAFLALLVLALFFLVQFVDESVFYIAYANFTGIALILVVAALIIFPEILDDISDAARITYAKSTLNDVDVAAKVRDLEKAMAEDKVYQNENLNLRILAEAIGLSGHQLSELINTHFGTGFSQFVRQRRVAEAKRLLVEDRDASILSISLATGFRSQSNFYAAFREIAGMSPGNFRDTPD